MVDYKKTLLEKGEDVNYTYLKLLQKYDFKNDTFHLIFEGEEDQSFYMGFIKAHIPYKTIKYISNGKPRAIELYNLIDWTKYNKNRILFFLDKDYSDLLGDIELNEDNVFTTSYYSIENYLNEGYILERLLHEIYHLNDEEKIDEVIADYKRCYGSFYKEIISILAWILVLREDKAKVNLNNIALDKFINIEIDLTLRRTKINKVTMLELHTGVVSPKDSYKRLKSWIKKINAINSPKKVIRGKFELWFFVSFLNKMNKKLQADGIKTKVSSNINVTNAIQLLGPRVIIPETLNVFLAKNYQTFLQSA